MTTNDSPTPTRRNRLPGAGSPRLTDVIRVGHSLTVAGVLYRVLTINTWPDRAEYTTADPDGRLHTLTHYWDSPDSRAIAESDGQQAG